MFAELAVMGGSALLGGLMGDRSAKRAASAQQQAADAAIGEERRQHEVNRADTAPYRAAGSDAVSRVRAMLGIGPTTRRTFRPDVEAEIQHRMDAYGHSRGQAEGDVMAGWGYTPGTEAMPDYGSLNKQFTVKDFWADPVTSLGYEAGLSEGRTALDNSFGARGMLKSGERLKALTRFGQDYARQEAGESYGRYFADQDRTFNRLSGVAGTGQTAATNTAAMGNASAGRVSDILTGMGNARGAAAISGGNAWGNAINTVGNWWGGQRMLDRMFPQSTPRKMDWGSTGDFSGGVYA